MKKEKRSRQLGFSLIEMLIVVVVMSIITGAIFSQIDVAHRNSQSEQIKLDLFQEVREFTDQISRDVRATGYPSSRNFDTSNLSSLAYTDVKNAVGLIKLDVDQLQLESAVQGDGTVWVIRYRLVQDGPGCPCLQRSQTAKVPGDPLSQSGIDNKYVTEVQHVENGGTADPIFRAFRTNGTEISLPIDLNTTEIADINSVMIKVTVRTPKPDLYGKKPSVTMISTVRISNCSQGYLPEHDHLMGC